MPLEYDELIESFVVEASEAVADLEADFLAIEEGGADIDDELVAKVFRNIHSMKGTAGFCGLERIGALAHEMENVLNLIRGKELVPTPGVVEVLLRGADQLTSMVQDVLNSNEADTARLEHELQLIEKLGPPEERDEDAAAAAAAAPADGDGGTDGPVDSGGGGDDADDEEEWEEIEELFAIDDDESDVDVPAADGSVAFLLVPTAPMNEHRRAGRSIYVLELDLLAQDAEQDRRPADLVRSLDDHGAIIQSYVSLGPIPPVETADADELGFVVLYATEVSEEMLPSVLMVPEDAVTLVAAGEGAETEPEAGSGTTAEAAPAPAATAAAEPASAEKADAPAPAAKPAAPAAPATTGTPAGEKPAGKAGPAETPQAQQYLRVSVGNLDTLMNLAGELVLSRNQLIQAAAADDGEEVGEPVDAIAARIDRITSELQEAIMQTRMQPVGSVFNKFPRIVRDLSAKLEKQIELDIHGKEVELDKSIIEAIGDPLTHLIRNACDHGVETPDRRTAAGKGPQGTVTLRAFHQAGKVFITIEDDGNGIDPGRMRVKAVEKGLMTEDQAAELPDSEAQNLIFHAGFSTAEQVTDVSGRGVGMDVVRTNIESLGGMIEIDSRPGVGSKFQIQLPLTLAIIPSLVIFNDGNRYAIPQTNISELIRVKPEDVHDRIGTINDAEVLRLRGDLLPLIDLVDVVDDGRGVEEYAAARGVTRRERPSETGDAGDSPAAAGTAGPDAGAPAADAPADPAAVPTADAPADPPAGPPADGPDDAPAAPAPDAVPAVSDAAAADGLQPSDRAGTTRAVNIIVVEAGTLRYGLVVDEVADSQEIVVKPLGRHMKSCQILAGATVLGDGQVALILDLTGVAIQGRLNKKAERVQSEQQDELDATGEVERQSSLLFTNHPDEIFAVPTALISRIERISADEIENLGGRDILQYGGKALPLMSLEHHVTAQPRPEQDHYHVVVFSFGGSDLGLVAPRLVDIRGISTEIDQNTFVENGIIGSVVEDDHGQEKSIRILDVVTLGRTAFPDRFQDVSPIASSGPKTILLAEDSNFFRRQVISFLESDGYEVVGCEDGQVAWQVLQDPNRRFDMVLTDIEMPNMNGYELTRTIRADPMFAHLPIIALSSLSSDEDIKRAKDAGVDSYQIKMDREALLQDIRTALREADERAGLGMTSLPQGVPA